MTHLRMWGNRESCPRCGELAESPEGTFNIVGETIEVLEASDLTRERLARLQRIVEAAQAGAITPEEAADAVVEEVPAIGSLMEQFSPRMGRALILFLFAVIQLLAAQTIAEMRDDSATKQDVIDAVNQVVDECGRQAP